MYLPVPVIEPESSVFLGRCVTHKTNGLINIRSILDWFALLWAFRGSVLSIVHLKWHSYIRPYLIYLTKICFYNDFEKDSNQTKKEVFDFRHSVYMTRFK